MPLTSPVAAAFAEVTAASRAAVEVAGDDTVVDFPAGPVALDDALRIRVQDVVVHLWDIAVADLVAAAPTRRTAGRLSPDQFAPPSSPADGAELTRLLAAVGRDARWPGSADRPHAGQLRR